MEILPSIALQHNKGMNAALIHDLHAAQLKTIFIVASPLKNFVYEMDHTRTPEN